MTDMAGVFFFARARETLVALVRSVVSGWLCKRSDRLIWGSRLPVTHVCGRCLLDLGLLGWAASGWKSLLWEAAGGGGIFSWYGGKLGTTVRAL